MSAISTSDEAVKKKTLIAGLGNILMGDEGVGAKVVEEIEKRCDLPEGVSLMDGGTAGYALIDYFKEYDRVVIIDAVTGGGAAGTIYRLNYDDILQRPDLKLSGHQIGLPEVLLLADKLGDLPEIVLIGVEPASMDYGLALSSDVCRVVDEAVSAVFEEIGISP